MWLAGALGVACGTENYLLAMIALTLAAIILAAIRPLESKFGGRSDCQNEDVSAPSDNDTPME